MEILVFSTVISVILEVISVDFGDFGESCYPSYYAPIQNNILSMFRLSFSVHSVICGHILID